ncbi:hypothetical protein SUNI508_05943 [Seiridium unicorne]|uniref:Uncharacterized protein n=1 Tax=Seiridium unicorne TaxID=138068 RepID=A0ABR2V3N8_9PEZI
MVHLASIPKDHELGTLPEAVKKVTLKLAEDEDLYTTSVYGSKFAGEDLPRHEMPDGEMPKDVAYRMIKDELSLDGNPMLNLASFVTTYMVSFARNESFTSFVIMMVSTCLDIKSPHIAVTAIW